MKMNATIKICLTTPQSPCCVDCLVDTFRTFLFHVHDFVLFFNTPGVTLCFVLQFVLAILLCGPIDFKLPQSTLSRGFAIMH